jgi:hypothetical protein
MGRKILKLCELCLVTAVVPIAALIVWLLRPLEEQTKIINALDSRYKCPPRIISGKTNYDILKKSVFYEDD